MPSETPFFAPPSQLAVIWKALVATALRPFIRDLHEFQSSQNRYVKSFEIVAVLTFISTIASITLELGAILTSHNNLESLPGGIVGSIRSHLIEIAVIGGIMWATS